MSDPDTLPVLLRGIEDCLTEAACADDSESARVAVERGMRTAQVLLKKFPDHYQAFHTLGVLWYHHPDKTPARASKVKELLKRALELNPASQFSIQYLAYVYFDERDYRTALGYYEQTDRKFFESEDQLWRWLKAWECSIACRIHLEPASLSTDEIQAFIGAYHETETEDESPKVQWELWESLQSLSPEYRARHAEIIATVREFIIASGNEFVLEKIA